MRIFIYLAVLTLSLPTFASWHPLENFMRGTTWCLEDNDGPRTAGRLQFRADGTGKYDVVDAPGSGGIAFTWETWENSTRQAVVIRFASGFKPKKQFADVVVLDRQKIVLTWVNSGREVSFANRCTPARFR